MCAGAIVHVRLARVIFGLSDPKAGAVQTLYAIASDGRLNHRADVTAGVLAGIAMFGGFSVAPELLGSSAVAGVATIALT